MRAAVMSPASLFSFRVSPAFVRMIEERVCRTRPFRPRQMPQTETWQVSIGPIVGKAGTKATASALPFSQLFKLVRICASDSVTPEGSGTVITQIRAGRQNVLPNVNGGIPTSFLRVQSLGSGIALGQVLQPGESISIEVAFLKDCTFHATAMGVVLK